LCWLRISIGRVTANQESFTAKMVVSENDIAPDIGGVQTVWIQGVGCGTGIANFN
jgi:hypothetical protein